MEILFKDVEEIEQLTVVYGTISVQIRMYRLELDAMGDSYVSAKSRGFRYVLINPRDPAPVLDAFRRFKASRPEQPDLPPTPRPPSRLPDWLQPR